MTFQRWAHLLIGVMKGDFMASTVSADGKGEAMAQKKKSDGSSPAFYKLIINRLCQRFMDTTIGRTDAISLETKTESSRSVKLQMKCIITAGIILSLLTQCREEVRLLSLPSLVTFPTTMLHRPIDFTPSCIHELVTVITSRQHPFLWMSEVAKFNFRKPSALSANGSFWTMKCYLAISFSIACTYRCYVQFNLNTL